MWLCVWILLVLVILALFPGISLLRTRVQDLDGKKTRFTGLDVLLQEPNRLLKLLVVHGMGTHRPGDSSDLTNRVARGLGLPELANDVQTRPLPAPAPHASPAVLQTRVHTDGRRTLHVFELTMSPLTCDLKDPFERFDHRFIGDRAWVNRHVKATLVNNSLSDVALYLANPRRAWLRNAVKRVVSEMVNGTLTGPLGSEEVQSPSLEKDAAVAIITQSLGSEITLDSIRELAQQESDEGGCLELLRSTTDFFMLANQLPLLDMAESKGSVAQTQSVETAMHLLARVGGSVRQVPLDVVTISDPNDLLSYPLPPAYKKDYPQINFVNVTTLIAWRFLCGLVANPVQAHTGHIRNHSVLRMVLKGQAGP